MSRPAHVLLVEDNPGDVVLVREALRGAEVDCELTAVGDGEAALAYLRREGAFGAAAAPDLVVCDLNLPRRDGREVLEAIREDPALRVIPVVMLTSSAAERDVTACYERGANSYVVKPRDLDGFTAVIHAINRYWLGVARLPDRIR
jgi:two-component system, chemotaxis family, response regulator Rcp1